MTPSSMPSLAEMIVAAGLLASALCSLGMALAAVEFFGRSRRRPNAAQPPPPASVLKPLKGADPELYENLASLCRQDYASFQIVCGVADAADPAADVVARVRRQFPDREICLVVDPRTHGSNHKVSNLQNMLPHARHDFLVIADADIRTNPDYLRRLAAGISEPAVGAVTCLYRALPRGGLAARLEALSVNTDFAGMVLLARRLERTRYAFGATIALRRQTLSEIGGLEAIANHLADDYEIGRRVADLGLTIAIDGEPVDTLVARESWPAVLHHQVRWARTQRVCRPAGYFFTILTNGTLWALLSPFVFSPAPLGLLAGTAVLTLRLGCAAILLERLRIGGLAANLVSLPAKDLLLAVVWLMAFTGNGVRWRGRRLRVRRNGEMIDVIPSLPDGLSEDGRGPAFEA